MNTQTGDIGNYDELVKEAKREGRKRLGPARRVATGQIIRPIDPKNLSQRAQALLKRTGRATVTRNSRCPCGSQKRFKKCCMTT